MKKIFRTLILTPLSFLLISGTFFGVDTKDTRLLSQPAVSAEHIAFVYANDLWIANLDGTFPRRLTVDEGQESNPVFSPNGKHIAFSAQYDGNTDVFIVPTEGGVPKRLTWHPGADIVRGFTPDGSAVLFASQREIFTNRYMQFFTVPIDGGFPTRLVIPNGYCASYSPDGNYMAYTPIPGRYAQWKNYRGGTVATIWIFSFDDHSVEKLPQPEGRCNDTDPIWIGNKVYFRSDRNGEFNLFSYDTDTKDIEQLTFFTDFPIIKASHGNGRIIFEQAGYLHLFNLNSKSSEKITVGIATDLLELRPRYVSGNQYIRSGGISPTGARAVFDFRGDIITVPAEKGDPRNITLTTGAHEKYPTWSPDGKSIAYFSDASGEYMLHIAPQDGSEEAKSYKLNGAGFYAYPHWSPDSKNIAYVDNSRSLYIINLESGEVKKIASDEMYIPGVFRELFGS